MMGERGRKEEKGVNLWGVVVRGKWAAGGFCVNPSPQQRSKVWLAWWGSHTGLQRRAQIRNGFVGVFCNPVADPGNGIACRVGLERKPTLDEKNHLLARQIPVVHERAAIEARHRPLTSILPPNNLN